MTYIKLKINIFARGRKDEEVTSLMVGAFGY